MSDANDQPNREDRPDQVKPKSIEQKARKEEPGPIITQDQSTPSGRRPLFRS